MDFKKALGKLKALKEIRNILKNNPSLFTGGFIPIIKRKYQQNNPKKDRLNVFRRSHLKKSSILLLVQTKKIYHFMIISCVKLTKT